MFIDNIEIEIDAKCNLVQAAEKAGVEIPHYCWHPDLSVVASCRMCLVEMGTKSASGEVTMLPRLVPACQTLANPGTVIKTNTEKVKQAQQQTLEFLLLNHPLDCSICDQAGECYLQDYSYKFGRPHSRLHEPKVQRQDKDHIGDQIALFTDRCVMCTRCVRFTREVSGTAELQVISRGSVEEIDVFPGQPCNNKLAGNVVDLCPVGALCSKDFLYKKRVWWLKSVESVCPGCSTGCSIHVDQNKDQVYRIRPRENPQAQGSFMCDDGRFGWKYIHGEQRLTGPRQGRALGESNGNAKMHSSNGNGVQANQADLASVDPWPDILLNARSAIAKFAKSNSGKFVAVLSPFMACEEAYLLCTYLRGVDAKIAFAMGPVPRQGQDDCYPKSPKGEPPSRDKVRFTIRAEKCPNYRGVAAIVDRFQDRILDFDGCLNGIRNGTYGGAFVVGGYPDGWTDANTVAVLASLKLLVVLDMVRSPVSDSADFVLAGASFAEREGIVINHGGLAQLQRVAIRPPGDARGDGRILMELAGRKGLYHSQSLRAELAKQIPKFAKLGNGEIGEEGVQVL